MTRARISPSMRAISLLIAVCLAGFPVQARYGGGTETPEDPVYFADPILKALVKAQLGVTNPTVADMVFLKELSAAGRGISDLTGLEYATNLASLNLGELFYYWVWPPELRTNQIQDISPLSGLTGLKSLDISNNQITDISALSGLTALETLALYDNQITDISALSGLSNLTSLDMEHNQIADITPLSGLTNLTSLTLSSNPITGTSALSTLTGLESLLLSRAGLTTIPALTDLPNLTFLELVGNQITDMSGLSGMTAIETVTLFGNRITSIPVLSDVPNLKALGLGVNRITDISGLSGLTSLTIVDLTNNQITAIGPLTELPNLIYMDLQNNQITDISGLSGLSGLPNLIFLILNRNRIENLDALSDLPKLRFMEAGTNKITDIAGLTGLPSLETVDLSYNQIEAIPALSDLPNLRSMDLRNNRITDIAGLAGLTDLVSLDLANNDIEDIAVLSGLTSLRSLNLSNNLIEDISALTSYQRLDLLDLLYNPLDEDAYVYNLPAIEANNPGMEISYNLCPWAFERRPYAGTGDITQTPALRWTAGAWAALHDVYFGQDQEMVANATPADTEIYRGQLELDTVMYEPEILQWGTTYYWRIDEVNFVTVENEDGTEDVNEIVWKGQSWSFTTAEFIVADDFELYTNNRDAGQAVFQAWIDGLGFSHPEPNNPGNGTGSIVGHDIWTQGSPHKTIVETGIVYTGRQSMPLYYNNADEPYYSQTDRTWPVPQDWTLNGMDTFELYFRGASDNGQGQLYLSIEDDAGQIAIMIHPDPDAVLTEQWRQWSIPLADLIADGIDVTAIRKLQIGAGYPENPQPGGVGIIYIDDIRVIKSTP